MLDIMCNVCSQINRFRYKIKVLDFLKQAIIFYESNVNCFFKKIEWHNSMQIQMISIAIENKKVYHNRIINCILKYFEYDH